MANSNKKEPEKRFSEQIKCRHCLNSAPMEIVFVYSYNTGRGWEIYPGVYEDEHINYQLLSCPACKNVTLRGYAWVDEVSDPSEIDYHILYPQLSNDTPIGLPDAINRAFIAAQKVKNIDANAYAVLLGRVLEMVCVDRKAQGRSLNEQLRNLSEKGEIPSKLVGVADSLRNFRNIGAHASLGELTKDEVPILTTLCNAVLEYVYTAPHLVKQTEERLKQLQKRKRYSTNVVETKHIIKLTKTKNKLNKSH